MATIDPNYSGPPMPDFKGYGELPTYYRGPGAATVFGAGGQALAYVDPRLVQNGVYNPANDPSNPAYAGPKQTNPAFATVMGGAPVGSSPQQYLSPEAQDRANISYILNPNFDTSETQMRAAEQNLGQGVSGSGFGSGTATRLLESEKLSRFKLGHELLQPYLEREATAANLQTANAARLNEIAAQGAQALQQLQLSEAGQTARLSQEEAARLQQIALAGQQAMSELRLRESGESERLNRQLSSQENIARMNLGGNILQTLIQAGARSSGGGGGATGYVPPYSGGTTTFDWASQTHNVIPGPPPSPPSSPVFTGFNFGAGSFSSSVDRILRQYGVT